MALVALAQSEDGLPWGSPEASQLLANYRNELGYLPQNSVVVLPEKVFRVTPDQTDELHAELRDVIEARDLTVLIGLTWRDGSRTYNVAVAYGSGTPVRYDKRHLVPGLEDFMTPGDSTVLLPGSPYGLTICKDLDYPGLARDNAAAGARLLLVPALDFDTDGWLHSRIAAVRGIESGLSIVRAARQGRLTVTDDHGRVILDAAGGTAVGAAPLGEGNTVYARFGDWFAWLCLVLAAAGVLVPFVSRRRPSGLADATSGVRDMTRATTAG